MATKTILRDLVARLKREQRFRIKRSTNLHPYEAAAENEFAIAVENNLDDHLNTYRRKFGKTINTDEAKKLYKPYAKSKKGLTRYSRAVYAPAKALANELFKRELQSDFVQHVIFMGGGTASGKSTGIRGVEELFNSADLVLDGTLASLTGVRPQVISALEKAPLVDIVYIYCPFEIAIGRAVKRAVQLGRSLSLDVMAGTHFHSQKTLIALDNEFGDLSQFEAVVVDNSQDSQSAQPVAIEARVDYIRQHQYSDLDDLEKQALNTFHEVCDSFERENGYEVPQAIETAFLQPGRKVASS